MRRPQAQLSIRRAIQSLVVLAFSFGIPLQAGPQGTHDGDETVRGRRAAAGEVLVRFRQNTAAASGLDEQGVDRDERLGAGAWHRVHSRSRSVDALVTALRGRPDVLDVEPNYRVHGEGMPDDLIGSLWALNNTGQSIGDGTTGTPGADVSAVRAWDTTTGSSQIVVATVDTGIAADHPDLAPNVWSAPHSFSVSIGGATITCAAGTHGFNAITRTCTPADDNGHGTHVAGSIGATGGNGLGVVGINWTTSIMALKFLDATATGYVSDAIDAIEFAIQAKQVFNTTGGANVRVLNNSWSGGDYSQVLADEILRAGDNDMLFVGAAGNSTANVDAQPVYPASYSGANVLAVASTDDRDQVSTFSNYGTTTLQLAAPGTSIYSTYAGGAGYTTMSGTSMATAYVSGAAALVLAHCSFSTGALRDALLTSATRLPSLSNVVQLGRRLNAAAAVAACDTRPTSPSDIVLRAADIRAGDLHGVWAKVSDGSAAGGTKLSTPDQGRSSTASPVAAAADYFEAAFIAPAGTPYHVWIRMHAAADSKWNDSVWAQFSDALVDGRPAYAINTTSGAAINLEACSGCGVAGWGWEDGAYWLTRPNITFSSSGSHTLRIQVREDGVQIDQIVLSPARYLTAAPGPTENDATVVEQPQTSAGSEPPPSQPPPPQPVAAPFHGTPVKLPGIVAGAEFDTGGEGIAYHDSTAGNAGGAYRQADVDIAASSEGGYTLGWIDAGEWVRYSVDVAAAGKYVAAFRVASPAGGGTIRLALNGNVAATVTAPATGGWQNWATVSVPVTLAAGVQSLQLLFDSPGYNVSSVEIASAGATPSGGLAPYYGSPLTVPGTIQAADFDSGGEGVAYHDATAGNAGGAYRQTNVDISASSEGGMNVGWIDASEWMNYTVDVTAGGNYTVRLRVAAPTGGGSLHLGFNGASNVWKQIGIPATGGWQQWTTVSVPVALQQGVQQITLYFDTPGYNVAWLSVDR